MRQLKPFFSIWLQQLVGSRRPPGSRLIGIQLLTRIFFPGIQDGHNHLPGRFDLVVPHKLRSVPFQYVQQQGFIGFRKRLSIGILIHEVHFDGQEFHMETGYLSFEHKTDLQLRLNADNEPVRNNIVLEYLMRAFFKLDHDDRRLPRHRFAGTQKERNPFPTFVIKEKPGGDKGLCSRVFGDLLFIMVAYPGYTTDDTSRILSPDYIFKDLFCRQRPDLLQDLHLSIPDSLGFICIGTIHGDDTQQLKQVILDHIRKGAGAVIVSPPLTHTNLFRHADLNMVDIFIIPQRFKNIIGKPKGHDILDHLLPKIVIDMIDLFFFKPFVQIPVELTGGIEVGAKRLFHNNAVESIPVTKFLCTQRIGNSLDESRGNSQVKHTNTSLLLALLEILYFLFQRLIGLFLYKVALYIADPGGKSSPFRGVSLPIAAKLIDPGEQIIPIVRLVDSNKVDTENGKNGRQMIVRV